MKNQNENLIPAGNTSLEEVIEIINENQQSNEEWEEKFDALFEKVITGCIKSFFNSHLDVNRSYIFSIRKRMEIKPFKEFIRQQRQESYDEGFNDGEVNTSFIFNEALTNKLVAAKKQAVREYIEILKSFTFMDEHDMFYLDAYDIDEALEVYEGK